MNPSPVISRSEAVHSPQLLPSPSPPNADNADNTPAIRTGGAVHGSHHAARPLAWAAGHPREDAMAFACLALGTVGARLPTGQRGGPDQRGVAKMRAPHHRDTCVQVEK